MPEVLERSPEDSTSKPNEYAQLVKTAEAKEIPGNKVPEAWALDADRTLIDVNAAMTLLFSTAEAYGVDTAEIKAAQAQTEADGGSFDPLTFVKNTLNDSTSASYDELAYTAFCERFISAAEPSILYPDAERFLQRLQEQKIPHVIMTYGANPEWQQLKLAASGYPAAAKIMPHSDKGQEMEALRGADGTFSFSTQSGEATMHADELGLVDDKAKSFASLPADSHGYLIARGELLPSQQGDIPAQVEVIHSLDELVIVNGRLERHEPVPANEAPSPAQPSVKPEVYVPLTSESSDRPDYQVF